MALAGPRSYACANSSPIKLSWVIFVSVAFSHIFTTNQSLLVGNHVVAVWQDSGRVYGNVGRRGWELGSSATEIAHNDGRLKIQRLQFINDNIFCADPAASMTHWEYLLFSSSGCCRKITFKMAKKTSDFNQETVHIDLQLQLNLNLVLHLQQPNNLQK